MSYLSGDEHDQRAFELAGLRPMLAWLDAPPAADGDQLAPLAMHLATLRAAAIPLTQRGALLDRLYRRSEEIVERQLPTLVGIPLPAHRKTRALIRSLQDILRTLAEDLQLALGFDPENRQVAAPQAEAVLWRSLRVLGHHLLIGNLAAAPATPGIWQQLHRSFAIARQLDLSANTPAGATATVGEVYYAAVLLGCAQPASFTSREIAFVAECLVRLAGLVDPIDERAKDSPGAFWVDAGRDAPAFACARKTAPPESEVHYFSCVRVAGQLENQLAALEAGQSAEALGLPAFAESPAGRAVMRRLVNYWGSPGKRRFPRRRQSYRAALCAGIENLWRLFHDPEAGDAGSSSQWMILNESPDGYALMHVSGKIADMAVGDITALRTESGENWQICIVRWAQSENQEHLEIGLQIIATRAVPAFLALPADSGERAPLSVLVLPETPPLRSNEMLVAPPSARIGEAKSFVLLVEQENLTVREMRSTRIDEQNSQIEVFSIERDPIAF